MLSSPEAIDVLMQLKLAIINCGQNQFKLFFQHLYSSNNPSTIKIKQFLRTFPELILGV